MDSADIPFGPPSSDTPPAPEPLVVPEYGGRGPRDRSGPQFCIAIKTNGNKCGWVHQKNSQYCYIHDPAVPAAERQANRCKRHVPALPGYRRGKVKTIKDVLELISSRMDAYLERYGSAPTTETEQTICDLIRTYVAVHKCSSDTEAVNLSHWSRKKQA